MDLERIELQAFGPYPGREVIDFSRIDAAGVFLIEGPTGAGKSSIIDALVFALYGKTPTNGPSTHDDRLHSHHAAPDAQPFVTVRFTTAAGHYGITRTVAYQRPKQRGTGTTEQKAQVTLWRYADASDETGEVVSTRADEVGGEIQRIIGLTREQFTQTIVLPQGRFASFLTADPEKRSQLLETLFATGVYKRVEEALAAMRREAERGRDALGTRIASLWQQAAVDLEIADAPLFDATARDFLTLREASKTAIEKLSERSAAALAERSEASDALGEADEQLAAETALAARIERRRALRERREKLHERRASIDAQRAELSSAREAEPLGTAIVARDASAKRAEDAAEREAEVTTRAGQWTELDDAALAAEATRLSVVIGELGAVEALERELPARIAQVASLRESSAAETVNLENVEALLEAQPARREALQKTLEDAEKLAGEEHEHLAALEKVRQRVARFAALDRAARAVDEQRIRVTHAAERASEANDRLGELHTARWAGLAGELAESLVNDTACPVCGSAEHPHPAEKPVGHPSEDDLAAAREAYDLALAELSTEQSELASREATRVASEREVAGVEREGLGASITALEEKLQAARDAKRETGRVKSALADLDAESQRGHEKRAALQARIASLDARVTDADTAIANDEKRIRAACEEFDSVGARVDALRRSRALAEELLAARRALATAREALSERRDAAQAALATTRFASETDALAAVRSAAQREQLERAVREFDADLAGVEAGEAELADLPDDAAADVAAARDRKARAQEASSAATEAATSAREALARATRVAGDLMTALDEFEAERASTLPITRMADLASGMSADNVSGLSLSTFVLLRRFEEVVQNANQRLLTMSSGRYSLARSDEREKSSKRRVGLSLEVLDAHTDRPRNPGSLSGGETFAASLALALGLADAVRAESGGIELGTLFVDEGFGTLDPEYLEFVMAELGRLTETGRRVGVVSHVSELKNTIGQKISVRPTGHGSTIEQGGESAARTT